MSANIPTCQTCSSNLPPSALTAAFLPPCCGTPICAACVERNPRLREYIPCLRCGDPRNGELRGGGRVGGREREGTELVGRDDVVGGGGQVVFAIGDDDDDDGDQEDAPPGYDLAVGAELSAESDEAARSGKVGDHRGQVGVEAAAQGAGEEELETVEVRHTVARGDTLLSIARKYAADPHDLLTLNSLPPTALSTHPRILQTRKFLVVSRRRLPASSLPHPLTSTAIPVSSEDTDRDSERERARQLKRFQLLTKSTDSSVARTYLSLEELREAGLSPSEEGTGEALDPAGGWQGGGKKAVPEEGNREERALDRFWRDEEWEEGAGGPERRRVGRWKVVGGGVGVKS